MKLDTTPPLWKAVLAVALVTPWLAGCGGNDDDDTPPATTSVPASASASVSGFIAYLNLLVVSSADTLEPVDVASVTPPTEENTEPQPLN